MFGSIKEHLAAELDAIRQSGLYKGERVITTPQKARIGVAPRLSAALTKVRSYPCKDAVTVMNTNGSAITVWDKTIAAEDPNKPILAIKK